VHRKRAPLLGLANTASVRAAPRRPIPGAGYGFSIQTGACRQQEAGSHWSTGRARPHATSASSWTARPRGGWPGCGARAWGRCWGPGAGRPPAAARPCPCACAAASGTPGARPLRARGPAAVRAAVMRARARHPAAVHIDIKQTPGWHCTLTRQQPSMQALLETCRGGRWCARAHAQTHRSGTGHAYDTMR